MQSISWIINAEVGVICRSRRLRQKIQSRSLILLDIMRRPNLIIVLNYTFLKQSAEEDTLRVCKSLRTLHERGASKLAAFELDICSILGYHIELPCQLHTPLYIDWMLSTNQSFHSKFNV